MHLCNDVRVADCCVQQPGPEGNLVAVALSIGRVVGSELVSDVDLSRVVVVVVIASSFTNSSVLNGARVVLALVLVYFGFRHIECVSSPRPWIVDRKATVLLSCQMRAATPPLAVPLRWSQVRFFACICLVDIQLIRGSFA